MESAVVNVCCIFLYSSGVWLDLEICYELKSACVACICLSYNSVHINVCVGVIRAFTGEDCMAPSLYYVPVKSAACIFPE